MSFDNDYKSLRFLAKKNNVPWNFTTKMSVSFGDSRHFHKRIKNEYRNWQYISYNLCVCLRIALRVTAMTVSMSSFTRVLSFSFFFFLKTFLYHTMYTRHNRRGIGYNLSIIKYREKFLTDNRFNETKICENSIICSASI